MKFGTLICAIVGGILLIHPAHSNLDDGEVCINSMQCSSRACVHSTLLGTAHCAHKSREGEECSPQTIYGVYYRPPCERGLSCEGDGSGSQYGRCMDTGSEIGTGLQLIETTDNGYLKYSYRGNGTTKYRYLCADGYYGIAYDEIISTPTGCKKCPDGAECMAGYNEIFFCPTNYYRDGDTCRQCPAIGVNSSGTTVYGTTPDKWVDRDASACSVPAGTYTDASGTFVLSAECPYTL